MRCRRAALLVALLCAPLAAAAQQAPPRPAVTLDAGAIRRQAAQLAELRALLADPDPNVRLLTIREVAKSGDPVQRGIAIEAGLASAETAIQEVALRAVLADTQQIIFNLAKADGTPIDDPQTPITYVLTINKFDASTGKFSGNSNWTGQIQGSVLSFVWGSEAGTLIWQPEAGEFQGTLTFVNGRRDSVRRATWRPR